MRWVPYPYAYPEKFFQVRVVQPTLKVNFTVKHDYNYTHVDL